MADTLARKPQRLEEVDFARAVGMVAVISGHVLILFSTVPTPFDPAAFAATRAIYAFHMPVFFFLSGLVYRPAGLRAALLAAMALVVLAEISHLVGAVLDQVVNGDRVGLLATAKTMLLLRNFSIGVTWFLVALAAVRLLFAMIVQGGTTLRLAAFALIATSFVVAIASDSTVFQIQTWWAGVLFYALGQAASGPILRRLSDRVGRGWPLIRLGLGLAVAAAATVLIALLNRGCLVNPLALCGSEALGGRFIVRMIAGQYGFVPLFVAGALAGTLALMLMARLMGGLPQGLRRRIAWVGRRSLALLLLNGCFLVVANPVIRAATADGYVAWLPWVIALAAVAGHLAVLPLVSPVVAAAEVLSHRVAAAIVGIIPRRVRPQVRYRAVARR